MAMHRRERIGAARAPLPLLIGFALFVIALGYMLVASVARRDAPVFTPSPVSRVRAPQWALHGDTLTLDATDGDRWRRATLGLGRPLAEHDTVRWDVAARRYRITVAGAIADLGPVPFDRAVIPPSARFVASTTTEMENDAMRRWYRYSLVTHLLTPNGHVYALRSVDGETWKLQPLGYYCPGLTPGCFTFRYAPLERGASARAQGSSAGRP
ncbi:MAG TPA: HmuY family protein [Gemmatimonadaceae bacterium]